MLPMQSTRANIDAAQRLSSKKPAFDRQLCSPREDGHLPAGN
ncbi:hypothetical protein [Nocardia iowensis]|nr:hypothetical protein [Nocardia iowensis]